MKNNFRHLLPKHQFQSFELERMELTSPDLVLLVVKVIPEELGAEVEEDASEFSVWIEEVSCPVEKTQVFKIFFIRFLFEAISKFDWIGIVSS